MPINIHEAIDAITNIECHEGLDWSEKKELIWNLREMFYMWEHEPFGWELGEFGFEKSRNAAIIPERLNIITQQLSKIISAIEAVRISAPPSHSRTPARPTPEQKWRHVEGCTGPRWDWNCVGCMEAWKASQDKKIE